LRYLKIRIAETGYRGAMPTMVFLCPNTGTRVQGWFAGDGCEHDGDTYEPLSCLACGQVHMVNPRTGKILGAAEPDRGFGAREIVCRAAGGLKGRSAVMGAIGVATEHEFA
jgi:hypothetical protein